MADEWWQLVDRPAVREAIHHMNEDDLRFLNRLIVERLKLIHQARSTVMLARFSVGDRVSFRSPSGEHISGVIIRLNKKTVSITADGGHQWKVSPSLLAPAASSGEIQRRGGQHG